jgi:L-ascorbate metabolism protein UlaG (beta-lactamase superfamily)
MPDSEVITALHRCDVLLIPVGGYYTIDGAQAARLVRRLEPALVIPMHYRMGAIGYEVLSTAEDFLSRLPSFRCMDVSSLTLPQKFSVGCLRLTPLHAAR